MSPKESLSPLIKFLGPITECTSPHTSTYTHTRAMGVFYGVVFTTLLKLALEAKS